jgi:hypothetical protein
LVDVWILKRRLSPELRRAWQEHGRGETYLTIGQARALFGELLPGHPNILTSQHPNPST